jgi:hypothetical protein
MAALAAIVRMGARIAVDIAGTRMTNLQESRMRRLRSDRQRFGSTVSFLAPRWNRNVWIGIASPT